VTFDGIIQKSIGKLQSSKQNGNVQLVQCLVDTTSQAK